MLGNRFPFGNIYFQGLCWFWGGYVYIIRESHTSQILSIRNRCLAQICGVIEKWHTHLDPFLRYSLFDSLFWRSYTYISTYIYIYIYVLISSIYCPRGLFHSPFWIWGIPCVLPATCLAQKPLSSSATIYERVRVLPMATRGNFQVLVAFVWGGCPANLKPESLQ